MDTILNLRGYLSFLERPFWGEDRDLNLVLGTEEQRTAVKTVMDERDYGDSVDGKIQCDVLACGRGWDDRCSAIELETDFGGACCQTVLWLVVLALASQSIRQRRPGIKQLTHHYLFSTLGGPPPDRIESCPISNRIKLLGEPLVLWIDPLHTVTTFEPIQSLPQSVIQQDALLHLSCF